MVFFIAKLICCAVYLLEVIQPIFQYIQLCLLVRQTHSHYTHHTIALARHLQRLLIMVIYSKLSRVGVILPSVSRSFNYWEKSIQTSPIARPEHIPLTHIVTGLGTDNRITSGCQNSRKREQMKRLPRLETTTLTSFA